MKQYRIAIFDMDGTIVDSRPFHASVFEALFNENWQPVDYRTCYEAVGVTVRTVFESVGIPPEKHLAFFDLLGGYYQKEAKTMLAKTALAEGIVPVLRHMRGVGMKTAIVTNSLDAVAELFMEHHDIGGFFDAVVGADRHSHSKNRRCKALEERFRLCADEVLYIGDSESDMELAKEMAYDACFAKTPIAWFKDAGYIANALSPKYTVSSYDELLTLLKG